jgi:hypothetical protein
MKKTVKIDADLHRQVRARIVDEGGTIEDYVKDALVIALQFRRAKITRKQAERKGAGK